MIKLLILQVFFTTPLWAKSNIIKCETTNTRASQIPRGLSNNTKLFLSVTKKGTIHIFTSDNWNDYVTTNCKHNNNQIKFKIIDGNLYSISNKKINWGSITSTKTNHFEVNYRNGVKLHPEEIIFAY